MQYGVRPMASAPIIDFAALSLEDVQVHSDGLDRYLKQTGRLRMIDGILHDDPDSRLVVGYKDISESDWWAPDHVPGRPMFPGALQIEAAAQLSTYDYLAHRIDKDIVGERFVGFGGLDKTRFRGQVVPGCRLVVATKLLRVSNRMFRYLAQAFVEDNMVFESEVLGVIV